MDTVDHDDLAAQAASEFAQHGPRDVATMSKRELRTKFARLLREYEHELENIRVAVQQGATFGAAGTIRNLQGKMLDEARAVQL